MGLGTLEKVLLALGSKVKAAREMPLEQIVSKLGSKAIGHGKDIFDMVKAHPGESASVAGLGIGAGMGMGGDDEDEEEKAKQELLKTYGLR